MLKWDIYEVSSNSPLQGVAVRGRVRKAAAVERINLLVENATDKPGVVRFALLSQNFVGSDPYVLYLRETVSIIMGHRGRGWNRDSDPSLQAVVSIFREIASDAEISLVAEDISNPVLSKLKCNAEERYESVCI